MSKSLTQYCVEDAEIQLNKMKNGRLIILRPFLTDQTVRVPLSSFHKIYQLVLMGHFTVSINLKVVIILR